MKILLPAGLDDAGRAKALKNLMQRFHRADHETTAHILDVYPNERGWVRQAGNNDVRQRVYYAEISTKYHPSRRRK